MASRTRPQAWHDWKLHFGKPAGELHVSDWFAHFYLLIQAAKCGLGMENVPRMLVQDDLTNGTLVAPLGFVPGPNRLCVWLAPHLARSADAQTLVDWLSAELRASEDQVRRQNGGT